jgi:hypothetical protein
MSLGADAIVAALESAPTPNDADYNVVTATPTGSATRFVHLAKSRSGLAALLVPIARIHGDTTRLTQGVALRSAASVEFSRGAERWREPAAVVECRDPGLLRTFAGMAAAVIGRLEGRAKPSWETVASLFAEWERLMGRRKVLKGESELGLWGELWCIARSSRSNDLIAAWRGPDAESVDFLLGGLGIEVKAGRRAGVHLLSQAQVAATLGELRVFLLSLHVMPDPMRGRSLSEMVRFVGGNVSDVACFEEKLAAVGYSRADDVAYSRRMVLLQAPRFYPAERVPRIRAADPGVTQIRYRAELPPEAALEGRARGEVTSVLGLNLASLEYPCA